MKTPALLFAAGSVCAVAATALASTLAAALGVSALCFALAAFYSLVAEDL